MKNKKADTDRKRDLKSYTDLVGYKVEFDFSKLFDVLRQTQDTIVEKDESIKELREMLHTLKEENEEMAKRVEQLEVNTEQNALTIQNYASKILELDSGLTKFSADTKIAIAETATNSNAKMSSLQSALESKLSSVLLDVQSQVSALGLQITTIASEGAASKIEYDRIEQDLKQTNEYRTPKVNEKSIYEIELEQRVDRVQTELFKDLDSLRTNIEAKLYELDNKLDDVKAEGEAFKKSLEKMTPATPANKTASIFEGKSLAVSEEIANELYQRYQILSEELEEYKQMVINACVTKEEGLLENYTSFQQRLELLEKEHYLIGKLENDQKSNFDLLAGCMQSIKKTLLEKMKIKVALPGLDGNNDKEPDKIPSFSKETMASHRAAPTPRGIQVPTSATASGEILGLERKIVELHKELMRCASKESVEKLDQGIRYTQGLIAVKVDRKDFENVVQELSGELKKQKALFREIKTVDPSSEKKAATDDSGLIFLAKQVEEDESKIELLDKVLSKVKLDVDDLASKIEQRASTTEVLILRQSLNDISEQITRLCQILDDVDNPKDSTARKDGKSIRLTIFRLEQRIEELEKEISELVRSPGYRDGADPEGRTQSLRRRESGTETPTMRQKTNEIIKGLLARHDSTLNEVSIKVVELENSLKIIEPENMRKLIKSIAEIIYQGEKKEMVDAVHDIKGSQMKHAQLVENIREEIKSLDERFMQNIKRKIEKKDLHYAKAELQRKLQELEVRLQGTEPSKTQTKFEGNPLLTYNSKCVFCNQEVKMYNTSTSGFDIKQSTSLMHPCKAKYGPGYSRVLNILKDPMEYEVVFPHPSSKETSRDSKKLTYIKTAAKLQRSHQSEAAAGAALLGVRLAPIGVAEAMNNKKP